MTIDASTTAIADTEFQGCTTFKSIIWNSAPIVSIGKNAFADSALTDISLPDSVTTIGDYAFYACPFALTKFVISSSSGLTTIGREAFGSAFVTGYGAFELPHSVTNIGDFAFKDANVDARYTPCSSQPEFDVFLGEDISANFCTLDDGSSQIAWPGYRGRARYSSAVPPEPYKVCEQAPVDPPTFAEVELVKMSPLVSGALFGGGGLLVLAFFHLIYMSFFL